MIKLFVIAVFCLLLSVTPVKIENPDIIKIGIFSRYNIDEFNFSALEGSYYVIDNNNGEIIKDIKQFENVLVKQTDNQIKIVLNNDTITTNEGITFSGQSFKNTFLINPINGNIGFRIYDDDLSANPGFQGMTVINSVPFENYIAGVVQSESGFGRHPEYYNLQATISRTYAIKNLNRHIHEDFHLCDEVHCQAYYGKSLYPAIIFATEYTRGDVIIDKNNQPINTVFHANCGGTTVNSEHVWINASTYLKSVKDTFCIDMPGSKWEKTISEELLRQYLQHNLGVKFNDSIANSIFNLTQTQRKFFLDPYEKIHLGRFRTDFDLRSTYFDMIPQGDSILLKGRGYGHGVGLCQEGAMRMAEKGISRDSIIRFYYKDAKLETSDNY